MFCSNCGNKLEDSANFCPKCGSKVAGNAPPQPSAPSTPNVSFSEPDDTDDTFTDKRDGKVYKTVKIGKQVWMAENLAYNAEGSKVYDDDPVNLGKYGRLYDWETAMKACPDGWHLPSYWEWEELVKEVGGTKNAAKNLCKEGISFKNVVHIDDPLEELFTSTDYFGFAASFGGKGDVSSYNLIDYGGYWWSSSISENDNNEAFYVGIVNDSFFGKLNSFFEFDKFYSKNDYWLSVRCIKGPPPKNTSSDSDLKSLKSLQEMLRQSLNKSLNKP